MKFRFHILDLKDEVCFSNNQISLIVRDQVSELAISNLESVLQRATAAVRKSNEIDPSIELGNFSLTFDYAHKIVVRDKELPVAYERLRETAAKMGYHIPVK